MSVLQFAFGVSDDREKQTYSNLYDVAEGQKNTVSGKIDAEFNLLGGVSEIIAGITGSSLVNDKQAHGIMKSAMVAGSFSEVVASVNQRGFGFDQEGTYHNIRSEIYFERVMNGESTVLEKLTDGSGGFVLAVPIKKDGEVTGVIAGRIEASDFSAILSNTAFDGKSITNIITSAGEYITSYGVKDESGFFDDLGGAVFCRGVTAQTVSFDMENGRGGVFVYTKASRTVYAAYVPLLQNGWYILTTVPATAVETSYSGFINRVFIMAAEFLLIAAVSLAIVIYINKRRRKAIISEKERFRLSEERYRLMDELVDSVMFEADMVNDRFSFSQSYERIYGRHAYSGTVSSFAKDNPYIYPDDKPTVQALVANLRTGVRHYSDDIRVRDATGNFVWVRIEFMSISGKDGEPVRAIGKMTNIEKEKQEISELQTKAQTDLLTGIDNHMTFKERVTRCITADSDGKFVFILVDIDNFKLINDTMGHISGDDFLVGFSAIIAGKMRHDSLFGRLGGDEFGILAAKCSTRAAAESIARRALEAASESGRDIGYTGEVTCSIGIAFCPDDGRSFEELYKHADEAMYRSKELGKNRFTFYQ